jgi:hypothetical protein
VVRADAAGWHADHYVVGSATSSEGTSAPDITRIGAQTGVSWIQRTASGGYGVVLADDSSGTWRTHTFRPPVSSNGYGPLSSLHLAYSEGRLLLGWSTPVKGRAFAHVAERFRGRWVEADLGDGLPNGDAFLVGLAAFGGRAQVVMENRGGDRVPATMLRHQ